MIIDHIEDDSDAQSMCAVDKTAEINGSTVKVGWREQTDAIVSPAEPTRKIRDWHQLDAGNAELGESRKLARGSTPAAFPSECAYVHFVDDEVLPRDAAPGPVGPSDFAGIDNLRRSVRAFRLEP